MTLEGRQLAIGYRDRVVGRGLDVALDRGEVLALLGPNGSGKTTLLKTLLGLIAPLAGEVRIGDRSLASYGLRERARLIAYVPQAHVATFAFTVEAVVLMGRSAHGDLLSRPTKADRDAVIHALNRFGIGKLAARPYTMISGGERQLVLLARARWPRSRNSSSLTSLRRASISATKARCFRKSAPLPSGVTGFCSRRTIRITRCAPPIVPTSFATAPASPKVPHVMC